MADALRVDPEVLVASGALMDEHSQNVFVTHSSADQVIESSLGGWVGRSQAALAARASEWSMVTTVLSTRLYAHAEGLRVSGMTFAAMDEHADGDLSAVYRPDDRS